MRGCLRVCEDWTTGAAGRGADLVVDSRGAVHLGSGCKDAFDPFLFPRVPLRYALPWRSMNDIHTFMRKNGVLAMGGWGWYDAGIRKIKLLAMSELERG